MTGTVDDAAVDALLRTLTSSTGDEHLRCVYDAGATPKQIAAASGRPPSWVRKRLTITGADLHEPPGRFIRIWRALSPTSDEETLRDAYEVGVSAHLMCSALETDWPTLRTRLEGAGVRIRPQPRILHPNIDEHLRPRLLALPPDASGAQMRPIYEAGASVETLSVFTDHNCPRAQNLLEQAGTTIRAKGRAVPRDLPARPTAEQLHTKYPDGVPGAELSNHTRQPASRGEAARSVPTTLPAVAENDDALSPQGRRLLAELSPKSSMDHIKATYNAGVSTLRIARQVGVNPLTIRNWFKKHGVPLRPTHPPKGPDVKRALSLLHRDSTPEELKAAYGQGASIADLATATQRSNGWVSDNLHKAGTPMRPPKRRITISAASDPGLSPPVLQQKLAQRLVALRSTTGFTQAQVAEQLGVSISTIMRSETFPGGWTSTFLRSLCTLYDLPEQEQRTLLRLRAQSRAGTWWERQGLAVPKDDRLRVGLRGDTHQVYGWAPVLVPELAQTPEYARAIEQLFDTTSQASQVEPAVALAAAIQRRVRRRGVGQCYVLDESVTRRQVGGTAVMLPQLAALSALARRGRLRVLSHANTVQELGEGFELCLVPELDDTVTYFPQRRRIHIGAPPEHTTQRLRHKLNRLWEAAEDARASVDLIEHTRDQMLAETPPTSA